MQASYNVTIWSLLTFGFFASTITGSIRAGQDQKSDKEVQEKLWKYDVDVLFCPENASFEESKRYQYSPKEGRIWLDASMAFGHATDAYHAQTSRVVVVSDDLGLNWKLWKGSWPGSIPNRVTLPNGSIVEMAGGCWERYPKSEITRLRKQGYSTWDVTGTDYCGIHYAYWMRRSTDGGHSWQEIPIHQKLPFFAHFVGNGYPLVLPSDDTLISFAYGNQTRTSHSCAYVLRSSNMGETWHLVKIADGCESPATEHVEELDFYPGFTEIFPLLLGRGRIFVMVRTQQGMPAYQVVSHDAGKTWSEPKATPVRAKHPDLVLLKDGTILCTYQRRFSGPYGVRARFTKDLGETWSDEIVIRDDIPVDDGLSVPFSFELSDGTLFTVFRATKFLDNGSARAVLGASRWSRDREKKLEGESRWTRGYHWIPDIPIPALKPKFNMNARGKSPWQLECKQDKN